MQTKRDKERDRDTDQRSLSNTQHMNFSPDRQKLTPRPCSTPQMYQQHYWPRADRTSKENGDKQREGGDCREVGWLQEVAQ